MRLLSKEIFIPETNGRSIIPGFVTYISTTEPILIQRIGWVDASDTYDDYEDMFSYDNGKTWTKPVLHLKGTEVPEGRMRYTEPCAFFDADTGKLVTLVSKLLYPKEKLDVDQPSVLEIQTYDPTTNTWSQPIETMLGYPEGVSTSFTHPIKTSRGRILFPVCKPGVDENGKPIHHRGFWSPYYMAFQAIGQYAPNGDLTWHAGGLAVIDIETSCRGISENTVVELKDGRIALVGRGDNATLDGKPGYKWVFFSTDDGETWSKPAPFGCTDGDPIESSATGSAIFRSIKNGRLYWIGNLALNGERAKGNWPRSPLVILEVDEDRFAMKRDTITVIDQRGTGDSPRVQMSNFKYYQDRQTGDVVLFLSRYGERSEEQWKLANYYRYRVEI